MVYVTDDLDISSSGSIFNHSCDPDAVVIFNGTTLVVRALRDIPHHHVAKVDHYVYSP